jgi:hypothetical protein
MLPTPKFRKRHLRRNKYNANNLRVHSLTSNYNNLIFLEKRREAERKDEKAKSNMDCPELSKKEILNKIAPLR